MQAQPPTGLSQTLAAAVAVAAVVAVAVAASS